jgi:hypothetical protein
MADFDIVVGTGVDSKAWNDLQTVPRLNANPRHPHRFWRVLDTATTVQFACRVNGVTAPANADLDGRLFTWTWVETFSDPPIAIPSPPMLSSMAEFTGQAFLGRGGFHLLMATRMEGGSIAIPFMVEVVSAFEIELSDGGEAITDSVGRILYLP